MEMVGKERTILCLALLIVLLIICNFAFVFSNGWSRLGWQVFSFGGLFLVCRLAGLSLADVGLSKSQIGSGLKYGLIAIGIIAMVFAIIYFVDQNVFRDKRYDHALSTALYSALLLVPLKTVIFEELAFRGIMPALVKGIGANLLIIVVSSSLLFGLWHIASAPKSDALSVGHYSNWLIVAAIFMATSAGGAILYFLRYQSDSLIASMLVHWFVNGFAIVLASLSWLHRP